MLAILGLAIGFGIAVHGAGIGQGIAANGAINAMARQPEMAGRLQTSMIIALAFVESLVIFAFVITFILAGQAGGAAEEHAAVIRELPAAAAYLVR